ncbi:MAG: hypothetical protein QN183_14940 [Armatimonadota bacterium]|nr:hypothetical protein [Armatimonadota bacterium]MDR7486928.1 hypothetical protein [Armatimonadota bacterium]MDR7534546.1 hypothetical protein [Armatimonadota bacterium]MDR7537639.1 hypothetical protein [Armatimonadota bacterium]
MSARRRRPAPARRRRPGAGGRPGAGLAHDVVFIERAALAEPVAVELALPAAPRPRLVGFWRGREFHTIVRTVAVRREHEATYHRVVTDRGAFDLRAVRRMHPLTLRVHRAWELCAELEMVPVARHP